MTSYNFRTKRYTKWSKTTHRKNFYINPTYERRDPSESVIQTAVNAIEMARLNKKNIIFAGDLNQEFKSIQRKLVGLSMKVSKFNYTRHYSMLDIDLIATTFPKVEFTTDYKPEFMSNHQWLKAFIKTEVEK